MSQNVSITVPADPEYARPVRMLAANLAVLAGLSVEDVEDARMVAEEGFVWCCATEPDAVAIEFNVGEGNIAISYAFGPSELAEDDQTSTYAELILSAVCDECSYDEATRTLRLTKSVDVADA